jgi:YbbR domain-containing protein
VNWDGIFRDHWRYKVAAFFIVFLLWLDLTSGERQSQEIVTRLIIDVQDSAWVLLDAPDEVVTTFQGPNRDLLAVIGDGPELSLGIREVTGPVMRVALDPNRVSYDRELGVRATLVVPTAVELQFEQLAERRVPVVPDLVTVPAMGFTVLRPLLVEPDSVTIRGGASQVEAIRQVVTRRVSLEELQHAVMSEVPLEVPAGARGVEIDPPSVLVTIPVDSLVVRQVRLPIRVTGAAASGARVQPDSVEVVVRGAAGAVRRQMETVTWATVQVDAVPTGPRLVPVAVELSAGGFVSVSPRPAEVTVRPEGS